MRREQQYESVIGLEVHVQLLTASKLFSGTATAYGAAANSQASAYDIALPGMLPVLNEKAVFFALQFGLAIDAFIPATSVFARKNYFYPDLPKGYQISQYEQPIVGQGQLSFDLPDGTVKTINIERAHLEEDAGKSLHDILPGMSGIDLNRAGTPLLEIVTKPELRSAVEAVAYLKALHRLVCYLNICDGNMQEGSFRCDANVSVRPVGETRLGTRTEIKNVNSFRFVEQAIDFEIARHIHVLESGGTLVQETRGYDPTKNETRSLRSKESAHDYRYFSDPDLLPVVISEKMRHEAKTALPELPRAKLQRFQTQYNLNAYDAENLTQDRCTADYFETVAAHVTPKLAANWILGELTAQLNKQALRIVHSPINAQQLAELLVAIENQTLSGTLAKQVFTVLWTEGGSVQAIIEKQGLQQINDTTLITQIIDEVLAAFPEQVREYQSGKDKLAGFFVGQIMKKLGGKANPQQLNLLLQEKLHP